MQANVAAVITAGVLALTGQTVCLWTDGTFDSGGEKMKDAAVEGPAHTPLLA